MTLRPCGRQEIRYTKLCLVNTLIARNITDHVGGLLVEQIPTLGQHIPSTVKTLMKIYLIQPSKRTNKRHQFESTLFCVGDVAVCSVSGYPAGPVDKSRDIWSLDGSVRTWLQLCRMQSKRTSSRASLHSLQDLTNHAQKWPQYVNLSSIGLAKLLSLTALELGSQLTRCAPPALCFSLPPKS